MSKTPDDIKTVVC